MLFAQLTAALAVASAPAPPVPLSDREQTLWTVVLTPYLADSLWDERRRYDAANFLMVPLHAAFARDFGEGQREFAAHFSRLLAARAAVDLRPQTELSWLQYLYLGSRFLVLATEHGRRDLVPPGLPEQLHSWVASRWRDVPALQWDRAPFPHGMRERIHWKLASRPADAGGHSYRRAVLAGDLFLFAIAADLERWRQLSGQGGTEDDLLQDILRTALDVFHQRVAWVDGTRWLFQPGVWADHPDFAYACRAEKQAGLAPCRVPDVAEDASHSQHLALWLRSLTEAYPDTSATRRFYARLRGGLRDQFLAAVAVPPARDFPAWRMHNFLDGRNGVYRWDYATLGPGQGYGPYELSGALLLGWWSFLGASRVHRLYRELAALFPLSAPILRLYSGPGPLTRGAEPLSSPSYLTDGTAELLCRLAAELD